MFKAVLRSLVKKMGYEVMGYPRAYAAHHTLKGILEQEHINLVLDVGANTGQFVHELRSAGYNERVISFEPLAAAHAQLLTRAQSDPHWSIAERTAVGAERSSVDIHIAGNSVSSSILPMLASHSEAAPESEYVGVETVPVNRLDDLYLPAASDRILLKIDVQGYEKPVLDGAKNVLASCHAVIVEMSLVPLYEGQLLAKEMWDLLAESGFEAWSLEPGFRNPETGRMLQFDGIFVRSN
jgi:FkbM family methyltransferase